MNGKSSLFQKQIEDWEKSLAQLPERVGKEFPFRDLSAAILSNAALSRINFERTSLANCNLQRAILNDCIFSSADFSSANLTQVNAAGCDFHAARFHQTDLPQSRFTSCDFTGAILIGADLSESEFLNCDFTDAVLIDVNIAHANLSGSNLTRARLNGSELAGSILDHAVFTDAILTQSQLDAAKSKTGAVFSTPPSGREDTVLVELVRLPIYLSVSTAEALESLAQDAGLDQGNLCMKAILDLIFNINLNSPRKTIQDPDQERQ